MSQTVRANENRRLAGFTLPELLLGAVTFIAAIGVAVNALLLLNVMWREDLALIEISRNANVAIEKMAHGAGGQNTGLAAAKEVSAPAEGDSGTLVSYTDMNDSIRSFYYSDGKINASPSGGEILSDVESATFSNVNGMIHIDITLNKTVLSKEVEYHIETQVSPRN